MKITAQDLASPSRPKPLPRQVSLRPRRWPPTPALRARAATIVLVGGLISLAFALGALAQAQGLARVVWRAAENPRFEIAAAWQRSRLPTLYLDVEFQDAQRLKADHQNALAAGVHVVPNAPPPTNIFTSAPLASHTGTARKDRDDHPRRRLDLPGVCVRRSGAGAGPGASGEVGSREPSL